MPEPICLESACLTREGNLRRERDKYREAFERMREAGHRALVVLEEVNSNYGLGYEVAGFHMNSDLEPLDNFITDAWGTAEAIADLKANLVEGNADSPGRSEGTVANA